MGSKKTENYPHRPPAVQFGNFDNYYNFHPAEERLKHLPTDLTWTKSKGCHALDIGCNTGELTVLLHNFLTLHAAGADDCHILGIDLDGNLINEAQTRSTSQITFKCLDIMNSHQRQSVLQKYFSEKSVERFDVVFCFSVTMWIHLNNGDEGLKKFLRQISKITALIVIEPQVWKNYKSAERRGKLNNVMFPHFKELKMRNNIEDYIEKFLINACGCIKIRETLPIYWNRKLMFFKTPLT